MPNIDMNKYLGVFASVLVLTSCFPQTQTSIPTPVTTITAKASPIPASQSVKTKVKNSYSPEAIANYLDVCLKSGNNKTYCQCSIDKAQSLFTVEEFAQAYEIAASGKKSPKMDRVLSACTIPVAEPAPQPPRTTISSTKPDDDSSQWVYITTEEGNRNKWYLNKSTVRKQGDLITFTTRNISGHSSVTPGSKLDKLYPGKFPESITFTVQFSGSCKSRVLNVDSVPNPAIPNGIIWLENSGLGRVLIAACSGK
jgi:hypothetical protein